MRRVRYQFGSLELVKGVQQEVWTFRFYDIRPDGKRSYKRIRIGTKAQYPSEATALKAVDALRLSVNTGAFQAAPALFGVVIERYVREELPERFSTRVGYVSLLNNWIRPRWGGISVDEVRTLEVERWLKSLTLASNTKVNIRNLMHLLFEWARRWELMDKNPIELVRQSARRLQTPRRITGEEFRQLLEQLQEPCRTMAVLAACLGLRIADQPRLSIQRPPSRLLQRLSLSYRIGSPKQSTALRRIGCLHRRRAV